MWVCACVHVSVRARVCVRGVRVWVWVWVSVCVCARARACVFVRVRVCAGARVCALVYRDRYFNEPEKDVREGPAGSHSPPRLSERGSIAQIGLGKHFYRSRTTQQRHTAQCQCLGPPDQPPGPLRRRRARTPRAPGRPLGDGSARAQDPWFASVAKTARAASGLTNFFLPVPVAGF